MEPLFHVVVPALVLLAAGFPLQTVFLLSPLSVVMDLDHWLSVHATLHNLFFPLLLLAFLRKRKTMMVVAGVFLFSHLLFDLHLGEALFYPLDSTYYQLEANATASPPNTLPSLHLGFRTFEREDVEEGYEQVWMSSPMLWMAALSAAAVYFSRKSGLKES